MIVKLESWAYMPERAHATDAGLDLRTPHPFEIPAYDSAIIDTGVHVQLPKNTVGFLKSKSGLNIKYGITSEGVIDEGYTGAIMVKLYNNSGKAVAFDKGDKISQLVILPCLYEECVEGELAESDRGSKGFGSTGK